MNYEEKLLSYQKRIESAFDSWLPDKNSHPAKLHKAMRYSLDAGGKRLRPTLLITAYDLYPSELDPTPAAVAVETLHTYSLIHDDLPCMDNSDLRRGKPTCHQQFDEATALLAGDALLTEAFAILAKGYKDKPALALSLLQELSVAAGSTKLIGGQMEDLIGEEAPPDPKRLDYIHQSKTAALIATSITMGIHLSAAGNEKIPIAKKLGQHLGTAFQIIDDILDSTADADTLGKSSGLDKKNGTLTYPKLYGIKVSKDEAAIHTQAAIDACAQLGGENKFFLELIRALEHRIS